MLKIVVPRPDVTSEEVSEALRLGLADRFKVLSGTGMNWNPLGKPRPEHPNMVTVGTGSTRVFRAEVTIANEGKQTVLHVIAGGIGPVLRLINRFWIARTVEGVLLAAPGLH